MVTRNEDTTPVFAPEDKVTGVICPDCKTDKKIHFEEHDTNGWGVFQCTNADAHMAVPSFKALVSDASHVHAPTTPLAAAADFDASVSALLLGEFSEIRISHYQAPGDNCPYTCELYRLDYSQHIGIGATPSRALAAAHTNYTQSQDGS